MSVINVVQYLLSIEIITPSAERRRTWKERVYLSRGWRERVRRAHVILSSLFLSNHSHPLLTLRAFFSETKAMRRGRWNGDIPQRKYRLIIDWDETWDLYECNWDCDIVRSRSVLNNLWIEIYLVWYIERSFLRDKWEGIMKLKGRNGSELIWHFCVSN